VRKIHLLQIEKLYYLLQYDLNQGKDLWFTLVLLDEDDLNNLLPGEISRYAKLFDSQTQYNIYSTIAQMEFDANRMSQARSEWMTVKELAEKEGNDDWMANALFGLANCERNAKQALERYQDAMKFCEEKAPKYLSGVYYNIGFTYRRMQDIKKAIRWYRDARKQFQQNPGDKGLEAKIANDLGYAYSYLGNSDECRKNVKEGQRIRQDLFPYYQLDEEVLRSKIQMESGQEAKSCFQLGLSYNTLGEIYRYDEDLDASLRNYTEALKLFKVVNNYQWQAKALYSRGETHRRSARIRHWKDKQSYDVHMKEAQEDIEESLYLCEKYRVKTERDTANRRMGRVLHDRAMHELEMGNKKEVRGLLVQARKRFEDGLKYARETNDVLEELSNLAELAFIVDDFMALAGPSRIPKEYKTSLIEFKRALDAHRKDEFRIYQFPVFDNLYILEKAATYYQQGKYTKALKEYLKAYIGLASDPGYGRTRYKQHFPHLTEQIEKLPLTKAQIWCKTFIKAWEEIKDERGLFLSEDVVPDLVVWCRTHLAKIETQKG